MKYLISSSFFVLAWPALSATELPSGLSASAHDVLIEVQPSGESWMVIRYLAPELENEALGYEDVVDDLEYLCQTEGLEAASSADSEITQIVVVLMDRPVERGVASPDATQYIGAYLPTNEGCLWNDF